MLLQRQYRFTAMPCGSFSTRSGRAFAIIISLQCDFEALMRRRVIDD
jgi:hypothetical protein